MFINTKTILSFTTSLTILPSVLGAILTDKDPFQKRGEVDHVWYIANGDIAPVGTTSNFNTILSIRNSILGWLHSLCRARKWVSFIIVLISLYLTCCISQFHGPTITANKDDTVNVRHTAN